MSKREKVTAAAIRLAELLREETQMRGLATWHMLCEQTYQELLKAAALEEPSGREKH